jgi:hypothetical protein
MARYVETELLRPPEPATNTFAFFSFSALLPQKEGANGYIFHAQNHSCKAFQNIDSFQILILIFSVTKNNLFQIIQITLSSD